MLKITSPTLLLDRNTCQTNIRKMLTKAEKHDVELIPHFKTHQSAQVGQWFREVGVKAITVTSVKMADYFAGHGWTDITIAFPVNVLDIKRIEELALKVDLKIFINSAETAILLKKRLKAPVKFYIEADVGDKRSGIDAENFSEISRVLEVLKHTELNFHGFYTHGGHTYSATSPEGVNFLSAKFINKLQALKRHFKEEYPNLKIAMGDTPSCSIIEDFEGIDSLHPGNFVYYDLVQHGIGACSIEEIAICLAVPVVAVNPERNEIIVHSGWVHQGKDSLTDADGEAYYGLVVKITGQKWSAPIPGARVSKLSQEHGVISLPAELINRVKIGDILGILPVHACATAVMMGEVWTTDGERLEMIPR